MTAGPVLTRRALNRATLERQLLLRRCALAPAAAVSGLVGMQAQVPLDPYVGLWARLDPFEPPDLATRLEDRGLVRVVAMRATIHLLTADDCLALRPLTQPVLDRELARHPDYAPHLAGVDLAPLLAFATGVLAEPRTGPQLRAALAGRFPGLDPAAAAYACRCKLALVQVPPRGVWGRRSQVTYATAEAWLGRPLDPRPSVDAMVLRYLDAFGPASVADLTTWCRLTGMRAVVDRLRPRLAAFRDERGRELFDLPDAPRPAEDVEAPPRLLPEYDNLLLSHNDRSRFVHPDNLGRAPAFRPPVKGTVLSGGWVVGTWSVDRTAPAARATLAVALLARLGRREAAAVAAEGARLLALLHAGDDHDVRLLPPA